MVYLQLSHPFIWPPVLPDLEEQERLAREEAERQMREEEEVSTGTVELCVSVSLPPGFCRTVKCEGRYLDTFGNLLISHDN